MKPPETARPRPDPTRWEDLIEDSTQWPNADRLAFYQSVESVIVHTHEGKKAAEAGQALLAATNQQEAVIRLAEAIMVLRKTYGSMYRGCLALMLNTLGLQVRLDISQSERWEQPDPGERFPVAVVLHTLKRLRESMAKESGL